MNIQEFLAEYRLIETAAKILLPNAAVKQLTEKQYNRISFEDFEIVKFDEEDGVLLGAEYNDACNCHPEYQTAHVIIPWKDIELQLPLTTK